MDNRQNENQELINGLREQNRLLIEQNQLLRSLIDKTPDARTVNDNFIKQQEQLASLQKMEKMEYVWSWVKFVLAAMAAVVVIYLIIRVFIYIQGVTSTLSQYMEQINSAFGKIDSSFGDIKSFFDNLGNIFKF